MAPRARARPAPSSGRFCQQADPPSRRARHPSSARPIAGTSATNLGEVELLVPPPPRREPATRNAPGNQASNAQPAPNTRQLPLHPSSADEPDALSGKKIRVPPRCASRHAQQGGAVDPSGIRTEQRPDPEKADPRSPRTRQLSSASPPAGTSTTNLGKVRF